MGGGFRLLDLVRPFLPFVPEVETADRKVAFRENVIYTVISLFVFLASNHGTVMELGITPIVMSGMIMQFFCCLKHPCVKQFKNTILVICMFYIFLKEVLWCHV